MLKIYGSDLSGPANKVRFVANALGIPYEYIRVNLREGEHKKAEFFKINPVGKVPAIDDDGFKLFESNAIIRYLADKVQSPLFPIDVKKRALVDAWIEFISHHVYLAVSKVVYNKIFAPRMNVEPDERSIKEGLAFLDRFLPIIDSQLSQSPFVVCGDMTLADIVLVSALDPVEIAGIEIAKYSHIVKWRVDMKKRDFYTKCFKDYSEVFKK